MSLDMYKLPAGLVEGVKIPIPKTDVVFTVKLPANSNEEFTNRLMSFLNVHVDEEGNPSMDVKPQEFLERQRNLFFDTCIIKIDGTDMAAEELFRQYPLVKTYLWDAATTLAGIADEEVQTALGKSSTMPNGKSSGMGDPGNTIFSSRRASKSEPAVQSSEH